MTTKYHPLSMTINGHEYYVEDNGRGWEVSIDGGLHSYLADNRLPSETKAAIVSYIRGWTLVGA